MVHNSTIPVAKLNKRLTTMCGVFYCKRYCKKSLTTRKQSEDNKMSSTAPANRGTEVRVRTRDIVLVAKTITQYTYKSGYNLIHGKESKLGKGSMNYQILYNHSNWKRPCNNSFSFYPCFLSFGCLQPFVIFFP